MIKTFEEVMENLKSSKYNRYFKELKINNANVPAIVDTGSDISIIRADVFQNLGRTDFVTENNRFLTAGDHTLLNRTLRGYSYYRWFAIADKVLGDR